MSRTIRHRQSSAAASLHRIDFAPSRLAHAIWLAWLAAAGVLVWQAGLPVPWRVIITGMVLAVGLLAIRRHVCLRGQRAVGALEWSAAGQARYYVCLGRPERRLAAFPLRCRRYGPNWWVLNFRTSEGLAQLLIDARCQEPQAVCRLARHLFGAERPIPVVPAARRRQAATIHLKV